MLRAGDYGGTFDARIEFYPNLKRFCIFHADPGGWRTVGRVRFSIAHEVGHFYLPAHRERLLKGIMHNSVTDFGSRSPTEIEADEFAADLLMPMGLFRAELNLFRNGFCDLDDLTRLADRLGTSITSTARRYCESDREPCYDFLLGRRHGTLGAFIRRHAANGHVLLPIQHPATSRQQDRRVLVARQRRRRPGEDVGSRAIPGLVSMATSVVPVGRGHAAWQHGSGHHPAHPGRLKKPPNSFPAGRRWIEDAGRWSGCSTIRFIL